MQDTLSPLLRPDRWPLQPCLAALVLVCTFYCIFLQLLAGRIDGAAFFWWFVTNPVPLSLAAIAAFMVRSKIAWVCGVAALAVLAVSIADLAAFPPDVYAPVHILERAREKIPLALMFIALGAVARRSQADVQSSEPEHIPDLHCLLTADVVKGAGNYVEAETDQRSSLIRMTLTDAARVLEPHGYLRVHRSWIVRVEAVGALCRDREGITGLRLRSGRQVPVGRSYRAAVRTRLASMPAVRP